MMTEKDIIEGLKKHFPNPKTELLHKNGFELLIMVILSAQTTDERVNSVYPKLFSKYPTPESLSNADIKDLEEILKPVGFFRRKAKLIKQAAKDLIEKFGGNIPDNIKDLVKIAGVGRKTASVILVNLYNKPAIVVDTHVMRVTTKRWKIAKGKNPEKVEKELSNFFSKENWSYISNAIVLFGRYICKAFKPKCKECALLDKCPYEKKNI
ncbi:endonuclease III [Venenivibrio stagnispumantis]|uniref:Endonuclease III n=1 Tax=Venenivibrio stagnispumantis TaxID=407998 RepID=A0AA45WPV0_9AQUI|nr:endonuclease III [Venenivibrio stagnispumantis]MCW4574002.1 endonuclease III [Venenivibrio stagnispumantis]SMP21146.1 DNA-(apurinic or apyrimidinic site) lyase /endonuclease III [Venenivibrio stagnispumantis]